MNALVDALNSSTGLTDRVDSIELLVKQQQEEIEMLKTENERLHLLLFNLLTTVTTDIDKDKVKLFIKESIENKDKNKEMYGLSVMKYLNKQQQEKDEEDSNEMIELDNDTLVCLKNDVKNSSDETKLVYAITQSKNIEGNEELCDVLVDQVNGNSLLRERLAVDKILDMATIYESEDLADSLCEYLMNISYHDDLRMMQISTLITNYCKGSVEIKMAILQSGILKYMSEHSKELLHCNCYGLLLEGMKSILNSNKVIESMNFETLKLVVESTIWHEYYLDDEWYEEHHMNPYDLIAKICNSPRLRSILWKSNLMDKITDELDINNITCLNILVQLNKICHDELSIFVDPLKESIEERKDDEEYIKEATKTLIALGMGDIFK